MKKYSLIVLLIGALASILGCDGTTGGGSSGGGNGLPIVRGLYDLTFVPTIGGTEQYLINVEIPGGSGTAMVMITGPGYSDTVRVVPDSPIDVGDCGANVVFGSTPGFNLAAGDNWNMIISNGVIYDPTAGDTVDSIVGPITSGGTYTCIPPLCDGSMLAGAVPSPSRSIMGDIGGGGQWYSVNIAQDRNTLSGGIPEQKLVTLYLGSVRIANPLTSLDSLIDYGDTVTISYRRTITSNGIGGDFVRVIATNGSEQLDVDYQHGSSLEEGETTHSFTFTAKSPEIMVDFISGLSNSGDRFILDDLKVTTQNGVVFSETFEDGLASDCFVKGVNATRIERRVPEWAMGSLCVSTLYAPTGTYGLRFESGVSRNLTGSIVSQDSLGDLLSMFGNNNSLFGGGGVSGIFTTVWEPSWTQFLSSMTLAQLSRGQYLGTFTGESQNKLCAESGQLSMGRHAEQLIDLDDKNWEIHIVGGVTACDPPLIEGSIVLFSDTLGTTTGDTVSTFQMGTYVLGQEPAKDNFTNSYNIRGTIAGTLLTLSLSDALGRATIDGFGVFNANNQNITGVITGSRVLDTGRICEIATGGTFTITLVPKITPPPAP